MYERDAYSLAKDGTVSGLFLEPVTNDLLFDFPLYKIHHIRYLYLDWVNLPDFSFLTEFRRLESLSLDHNTIRDHSFINELKNLKSLSLDRNYISDTSFLNGLKKLKSLFLSGNNISDFSFLDELTELTSLDLSFNGISETSFLKKLKGLISLKLGFNNKITDYSFLRELKGLKSLSLAHNDISELSFSEDLEGLVSLDLMHNNISDASPLKNLRGLKLLNLDDNSMSEGLFLKELTNLRSLSLGYNLIDDCAFLKNLTSLKSLNLDKNSIENCSFLKDLKNLVFFSIASNHITDCPLLSHLNELWYLNLSFNHISDFSSLKELKSLESLTLNHDDTQKGIEDCSLLEELTGLDTLRLIGNNISDCSFLRTIKGLKTLILGENDIVDCSFLAELKELVWLGLEKNRIEDCSFLTDLKGLVHLSLGNNLIKEIPQSLAESRMAVEVDNEVSLHSIGLYGNPIEEPPLEIARQGNTAILNYYAQLTEQGQDHLYESKMLIVGEGEAGKTTLAHKIPEPNCPLPHIDDRTQGISIQLHTFPCRQKDGTEVPKSRTFHLNIWDFGGQEIYHATHRFFLSKRSLYVLVADNRKDDTDFNYWLNIIEQFAGDSPLIIVLNEKGDVQRSLNRTDLLSRYPDSIKEIVSVNFKTREEPDSAKAQQRLRNIHTLISQIEHCAQNLPHIGEAVPARWVDVRHTIEQDDRNYIYREQFDELCREQDITVNQDIDTLLDYFHDLGILLHFADNPLLQDRVILNPAWATNAVYRIFDDDGIKAKVGRFNRQDCADIWRDPQYRHMRDVLIELMKNFRLIYEIGTTGELVAPQLLPQNIPTYDWDNTHNSYMQFRYDAFMPKGIFWQFAVTMYRYISNHDWVWRNGMIIQRGNTWAEIREDPNLRRIFLRFSGPSISEFRAVIVDELDKVSQSYHRLRYDKMIPCQCSECKSGSQPYFFSYTVLKKRKEFGRKPTIECQLSEEDVPLNLLLEGFEVQKILERLPDKLDGDPAPPNLSQSTPPSSPEPVMQTIKIFLASSSELREDREQFEIFISRKNKEYITKGIFLKLVLWEDFLDAMSQTRLQDEYNKAISDCDVFVSLFHSKVGQYTREEFINALDTFKTNGKPLIYTYFKKLVTEVTRANRKSFESLFDFQDELSDKGHFFTEYANIEDLKYKFGEQLVKFLPQLTEIDPH